MDPARLMTLSFAVLISSVMSAQSLSVMMLSCRNPPVGDGVAQQAPSVMSTSAASTTRTGRETFKGGKRDYEVDWSRRLGGGEYGDVYLATSQGKKYAVKVPKKERNTLPMVEHEVRVLRDVRSRDVVKIEDTFKKSFKEEWIVMELVEGGSLGDLMYVGDTCASCWCAAAHVLSGVRGLSCVRSVSSRQ